MCISIHWRCRDNITQSSKSQPDSHIQGNAIVNGWRVIFTSNAWGRMTPHEIRYILKAFSSASGYILHYVEISSIISNSMASTDSTSIAPVSDDNPTSQQADNAATQIFAAPIPQLSITFANHPQFQPTITAIPPPQTFHRFTELPSELRTMIWQQHILQTPINTISIKIRLPHGSTESSRNQAAFTCIPALPRNPNLRHVNHELQEEFERAIPNLTDSPIHVFDTQQYQHGLRRTMLFSHLSMVELFIRAIPEVGAARPMNVEAVAVACRPKSSLESLIELTKVFPTLKVLYVVRKADSRAQAAQLAMDLYDELRNWQWGTGWSRLGLNEWSIPAVIVVSPKIFRVSVGSWTTVRCVEKWEVYGR
ncbi:hypothetical protein BKA61DRAFT_163987 [Leptodontidium sp. MPI-SDFR-AT-0119]|nr:hypothetical protein BKA61DRAFT_163987 [Leptodontidium sp. MPI-SDFR-AT-0119]